MSLYSKHDRSNKNKARSKNLMIEFPRYFGLDTKVLQYPLAEIAGMEDISISLEYISQSASTYIQNIKHFCTYRKAGYIYTENKILMGWIIVNPDIITEADKQDKFLLISDIKIGNKDKKLVILHLRKDLAELFSRFKS